MADYPDFGQYKLDRYGKPKVKSYTDTIGPGGGLISFSTFAGPAYIYYYRIFTTFGIGAEITRLVLKLDTLVIFDNTFEELFNLGLYGLQFGNILLYHYDVVNGLFGLACNIEQTFEDLFEFSIQNNLPGNIEANSEIYYALVE